jgi:hypothetical protein
MKENTNADGTPKTPKAKPKATAKVARKIAKPVAETAAAKASKTPKSKKVSAEPAVTEKKPVRVTRTKTTLKSSATLPTTEEVAVAAFLNWCQRRNQGLPDDPIADWIAAELEIGLVS